jgi:hypothetical protein
MKPGDLKKMLKGKRQPTEKEILADIEKQIQDLKDLNRGIKGNGRPDKNEEG